MSIVSSYRHWNRSDRSGTEHGYFPKDDGSERAFHSDDLPGPLKLTDDEEQELLIEVRENFAYYMTYWAEQRREMAIDLRIVAGDSWDSKSRIQRESNDLPCMSPDEHTQYLHQAVNNWRASKRAIHVTPKGSGATDKDAKRRAALIRGIEHASNAQAAYDTAYESAVNCGIGAVQVSTKYVSDDSDEQIPTIERISDIFTVLPDPNAQEADFSDMEGCFVLASIPISTFKYKYPDARKTNFTTQDMALAPLFFQGKDIVIAAYWQVRYGAEEKIGNRKRRQRRVTQIITNGVEILEVNPWPGSWIPIPITTGKEVYQHHEGRNNRQYHSLLRTARHSIEKLAFIESAEAVEFNQCPLTPFVGAVGQFESRRESWGKAGSVPQAYLEFDPVVADIEGKPQLLPAPTRPQYQPNAQAYAISREAAKRAVQSSVGIMPMPTVAQQQNQKSGIALQQIQSQEQVGSYHFSANIERMLVNVGRQINELITKVVDTQRHMPTRDREDKDGYILAIPQAQLDQLPPGIKEDDYLVVDKGEFDITISAGPSLESERQESSEFSETLMQMLTAGALPQPGSFQAKILALIIKTKQPSIGPIGDQMVALLDPNQQEMDPAAQGMIANANQLIQQQQQIIQALNQKLQAKAVEQQGSLQKAKMDNETRLAVAEITTKSQELQTRAQIEADLMSQFHEQAHEQALQAGQQASDQSMQASDQAQETSQGREQRAHEASQAQQQQQHEVNQATQQQQADQQGAQQ